MIAVDTNILVYAHRRDSDFHAEVHDARSLPSAPPTACVSCGRLTVTSVDSPIHLSAIP